MGIREVASRAGVSIATVSAVFNRRESVSESVRKRVLEAARELDYTPNRFARVLRGKSSHLVAYIVPTVSNPLFSHVLRGIEDVMSANEYSVILCNTDFDCKRLSDYVGILGELRIDGLIISADHSSATRQAIDAFLKDNIPVVITCAPTDLTSADAVLVNDEMSAYIAVRYLIESGHFPVGAIGVTDSLTAQRRLGGYLRAHKELGLAVDENLVHMEHGWTQASGRSELQRFIDSGHVPSAIFAFSDLLAIGALKQALAAKIDVPNELSIVGFDDSVAELSQPELTTVRIPYYDLGELAAKILLGRMRQLKRGLPLKRRVRREIEGVLEIRDSVRNHRAP